MAVKQHAKQKFLIVFSVAVVLTLLMLLALSGGNLALIKSLFIHDLSNEEMKELLARIEAVLRRSDRNAEENKARKLIFQGRTLESVGREVGYQDHSTFYRAFRQTFGMSPREYRKTLTDTKDA